MAQQSDFLTEISNNPLLREVEMESRLNYLSKTVNVSSLLSFNPAKSIRYSFFLLNNLLEELETKEFVDGINVNLKEKLKEVYYLLRSVDIKDTHHLEEFSIIWGITGISYSDSYYFYLATSGLLSENNIKVRIDLKEYEYTGELSDSWGTRVATQIIRAVILLVRKQGGLKDASEVLTIIDNLIKEQKSFEEGHIEKLMPNEKISAALELLGLYHISKILVETATYLTQGYRYKGNLQTTIARHCRYAKESLISNPEFIPLVSLIMWTCYEVQRNSIWYSTTGLGLAIEKLCQKLVSLDKIDLLPSQREALSGSLLDIASNTTIVQMPTSAGKTLLAEFRILQAKALNKNTKVIYLVPTRALVNQVVSDLRSDFEGLDLKIEKTSKVNDIDPSENMFLTEEIDILVSTPEKFDLMIRRRHKAVEIVDLVVIDEAHNIREGDRGAKLELLLAILKREKPSAKFLLLSPFLPNAAILRDWLTGGKTSIKPIEVDWRPSDRVFLGIKENKASELEITFEPSPHSFLSLDTQKTVIVNSNLVLTETKKRERLAEASAQLFGGKNNTMLFLCQGKGTAHSMAKLLLRKAPKKSAKSEMSELISKFIDDEIGESTVLSEALNNRIAIHHAGLTEDTKILIEHLIRNQEIDFVCATTTIAQGINFPISTVFVDSTLKGTSKRLTSNEFLNIAGRAGRTLVDNIGKIVFPYNSATNIKHAKELIVKSSLEIGSALTELILGADKIIQSYEEDDPQQKGKIFDNFESLGALVQYLVHLLTVSEEYQYKDKIQNLFKDSFGYFTLDEEKRKKFLAICETIYFDLQSRYKKNIGILKFSDKTGFSVPSILKIMGSKSEDPDVSSSESWEPKNLFDYSTGYLAKKIAIISQLREAHLGTDSHSGQFDPSLLAEILAKWVNGENLSNLSMLHPYYNSKENGERISEFVNYLSSATFKSSWGMSALEGVLRTTNEDIAENSHIPSYLYFGVNSKPAVGYRMIGVPRRISNNISDYFHGDEPRTYTEIRKRISELNVKGWDSIVPQNSKLSGEEWKTLTNILLKNQ